MIPQTERRITVPEDLWVSLLDCTEIEKKKLSPDLAGVVTPAQVAIGVLMQRMRDIGVYPPKPRDGVTYHPGMDS